MKTDQAGGGPNIGRSPCLDGLRNRRICRRHPSSMITEGSAGICAGRPDVCQTDSVAFRSVDGSPRLMPYIRPLRGAGSLKRRMNVWVDSCLRSVPPRMGSISHTLSRPLSLSKGRRRATTGYRSAGISTSSMNALRKCTSKRREKCRFFVTLDYILTKMAFTTSHDLDR